MILPAVSALRLYRPWVIEILSPATSSKDLREKFEIYEFAGVIEYWIVHPYEHTLMTYVLNDSGKYVGQKLPFVTKDIVRPTMFEDLEIGLEQVFEE